MGVCKAMFSILENNLYNCFAKRVAYTLFKKQTDTNSNIVQKCQHQILLCVNTGITKYGRKLYTETLPPSMLDPGEVMGLAHSGVLK